MLNGRLVTVRPTRADDLDFLAELAVADGVRHNVVGWDWPVSRDGQEDWFRQSLRDPRVRRLTVADPATDRPVGLTGLWEVDWHNGTALTATKLMPGATPRGAGTDSIMLIMAWAFHEVGLRRLHSTILPFNAASLGAYVRKCGWRVEGRDREAVFRRGEWHDLLRVAVLRREFDALPDAEEYVERVCGPRIGVPAQPEPAHSTNASVQSAPERPERASSIATA
ncbi:GNAT family N-acetyltransferase [Micromonospora okii]|uniref:GNAT family N-acetyltransferase n=1 Tax=Micromonospora okii TaxID=1182970 RepID=UPI001E428172|nr:GNAT family protein [Micromonospora okii]